MREGLDRVALLPVGGGYLDAVLTARPAGWRALLEAGWHPRPWADVYGYGAVGGPLPGAVSWEAGLGARVRW